MGFKNTVIIQNITPPSSGGNVVNERLVYDLPQIVPNQTVRDSLVTKASEVVPAQTETVVAALLARAEETVPDQIETIRTTVRPMISELVPSQLDTIMLAIQSGETVPEILDTIEAIIFASPEIVPDQIETIRITGNVYAFEAVPLLNENIQAAIIEQDNTLPNLTTSEPIDANLTGYANQNVATTTWATPANALGNTTNTASTLTATASGLAGTTNNTATGSITLGFQDVNLGDLTITNVDLFVENQGATAGVAIAQPTTNVVWAYSLNNGGTFTNFYTMNTPATAKGIRTVDITAIVGQDQALLSGLQIRASGTITSGTGLGAGNTVSFFRAWMVVNANRTY